MLRPLGSPMRPVEASNQKNDAVPEILKVLHLAKHYRVTQMQIWRGGVEANLDRQRLSGFLGFLKSVPQVFGCDDLSRTLYKIGQLFIDRHSGAKHGGIIREAGDCLCGSPVSEWNCSRRLLQLKLERHIAPNAREGPPPQLASASDWTPASTPEVAALWPSRLGVFNRGETHRRRILNTQPRSPIRKGDRHCVGPLVAVDRGRSSDCYARACLP